MFQVICSVVIVILVAICVPVHAADTNFGDSGSVLREETRVFLGPCFFTEKKEQKVEKKPDIFEMEFDSFLAPAIGGAVVVALAETAIDFSVGALKAAGEDKTTQAIGAFPANGWMYQLDKNARLVVNPSSQCIQIISGAFWDGLHMLNGEKVQDVPVRDKERTVLLNNRKTPLITDPDAIVRWESSPNTFFEQLKDHFRQLKEERLFFEASIEGMKGTSDKFVIAPHAMYFKKPIEESWYEFKPKRNILLTLSLANAGADAGKVFASVNFPFREVTSGTLLSPLYFSEFTSRAIQVPELTEEEKKSVQVQKNKLKKASTEVELVVGPEPASEFESPISFENDDYKREAASYCAELDKYNATISKLNKNATRLTAPECPVGVQVAKASLNRANTVFTKFATRQEAIFNTRNYWLLPKENPKSQGVTCKPAKDDEGAFSTNCELTRTSDMRPITVNATVVEVKEGSKFAAFLAKVLEKSQPTINKAIEAQLPEKKAASEEQKKADQEAYQLAVAEVAITEAKLADILADPASKSAVQAQAQKDLLEKKIIANQKARKSGLAEPYKFP